jgi:hypothetical protein
MRCRRKPTSGKLKAMGATPGLMAHKVGPDGRARLEQLTAEDSGRPSLFCGPDQTNVLLRARKETSWTP